MQHSSFWQTNLRHLRQQKVKLIDVLPSMIPVPYRHCYQLIETQLTASQLRHHCPVSTMKQHAITSALLLAVSETAAFSTVGNTALSRQASPGTALNMGILDFLGFGSSGYEDPCVMGEESIMSPKEHGTSSVPVQEALRWDCDRKVADNICNFNR